MLKKNFHVDRDSEKSDNYWEYSSQKEESKQGVAKKSLQFLALLYKKVILPDSFFSEKCI